jgi:hypothetical protein
MDTIAEALADGFELEETGVRRPVGVGFGIAATTNDGRAT